MTTIKQHLPGFLAALTLERDHLVHRLRVVLRRAVGRADGSQRRDVDHFAGWLGHQLQHRLVEPDLQSALGLAVLLDGHQRSLSPPPCSIASGSPSRSTLRSRFSPSVWCLEIEDMADLNNPAREQRADEKPMAKFEHTPGPWRSDYSEISCRVSNNKTDTANARLIAAAPDILAVLREYFEADTETVDTIGDRDRHDRAINRLIAARNAAHAAIAKAEGR